MGGILRVNYRLTGGKTFANDIDSILVHLRETVIWGSADLGLTLSMKGYGCPSWILPPVIMGAFPTHWNYVHQSLAAADSLVYVTMWAWSQATSIDLGNLGATASIIVDYVALIGSR